MDHCRWARPSGDPWHHQVQSQARRRESSGDCDVEVGFLHRGFDKSCEQATWTQVIPYTDRLNYASSLINNVGYALAVEKLIGAETPLRCQYIRVIISELARIYDHLPAAAWRRRSWAPLPRVSI